MKLLFYNLSSKEFASLPSRECGLKSVEIRQVPFLYTSLPSRECGLKFSISTPPMQRSQSLPSRECGLKSNVVWKAFGVFLVTPFAGVWIEIWLAEQNRKESIVTPFAGVWIEMPRKTAFLVWKLSLPSRECGLKCDSQGITSCSVGVTPFAGVWIEITMLDEVYKLASVTPFAGVWIEIQTNNGIPSSSPSLPSRECGLKYAVFQV